MKRLRCKLAIRGVVSVIIATFLWSNVVYASGSLATNCLGIDAKEILMKILPEAKVLIPVISLHSEIKDAGMEGNAELVKNLEGIKRKLLEKGIFKSAEEADEYLSMQFKDPDTGLYASYYFGRKGFFIRVTPSGEKVNDLFYTDFLRLKGKSEGDIKDINGYFIERFRIHDDIEESINICLQKLYGDMANPKSGLDKPDLKKDFIERLGIPGLMEDFIGSNRDDPIGKINARRLEGQLDQLKPANNFWLEDMDTKDEISNTIQALLNGELVIYVFAAGAADRLWKSFSEKYGIIDKDEEEKLRSKYRMWNVNFWEIADRVREKRRDSLGDWEKEFENLNQEISKTEKDLKNLKRQLKGANENEKDKLVEDYYKMEKKFNDLCSERDGLLGLIELSESDPPYARQIKLGSRHMKAIVEAIKAAGKKYNFDALEVIKNLKVVVCVNDEIFDDVVNDLKKDNFYGLNPDNVMLLWNPFAPGYEWSGNKLVEHEPQKEEKPINYNHGFNIINSNLSRLSYVYKDGEFRLNENHLFGTLQEKGAKTGVVHRLNDLILLLPEYEMDIELYALYRKLRNEHGANVSVELRKNPTGQKGGLGLTTEEKRPFMFLAEGTDTNTTKVKGKLIELTDEVTEQGLPGIPYNRMYQYFDIEEIRKALEANNGIFPMSLKMKNGAISPEIPVGNMTILNEAKPVGIMRKNDFLIDTGIIPDDRSYIKGQGALIHDFKELKELDEALKVVEYLDKKEDSNTNFNLPDIQSKWQELLEKKVIRFNPEQGAEKREVGNFSVWFIPARAKRPGAIPRSYEDKGINILHGYDDWGQKEDIYCGLEKIEEDGVWGIEKEEILKMRLGNNRWIVLSNIFPIFKDHLLFLPLEKDSDRLVKRNQFIVQEDIKDALEFLEKNPVWRIFFNSWHAAGTINHIHLQVIPKKLSIEDAETKDLGEKDGVEIKILSKYPATCLVLEGGERDKRSSVCYEIIQRLQSENIAHNILFTKDRIYIFPRAKEIPSQFPEIRFGTLEMCGDVILINWLDYLDISADLRQKCKLVLAGLVEAKEAAALQGIERITDRLISEEKIPKEFRSEIIRVFQGVIDRQGFQIDSPSSLSPIEDLIDPNLKDRVIKAFIEVSLPWKETESILSELGLLHDANISLTGDMPSDGHRGINNRIAGSPRYLLHKGDKGKLGIDYKKRIREDQKNRIEDAIEGTRGLSVDLPNGIGRLDVYETLRKTNILWVHAQPRSPPVEGHAGAKRNVIYLVTDSLEGISTLELIQILIEEVIELVAKQRMLVRGEQWTEEIAKEIHEFASKNARRYIPYGKLLADFCGSDINELERLLSDPSKDKELSELINRMNAGRVLSNLDELEPAIPYYFEDEKDEEETQEAIDFLISGKVAIVLYAAGEANRLTDSLVKADVITKEDAKSPAYKMWNLDLWDVAQRYNNKGLSEEEALRLGIPRGFHIPSGIRNLGLGIRHMEVYLKGLEDELKRLDKRDSDIRRAKENLKFVITVNNEIKGNVERDLIENNFFGLRPDNVLLVLNDLANGFVLKNGKFILSEDPRHKTNYNHGFNLINANIPGFSYVYNKTTSMFEAIEKKGFDYIRQKGADTVVVHRTNDFILLVPEQAVDVDMMGVWYKERGKGTNCMVEVMNNPTGQKGGLAVTDSSHKPYMYLIEGLAVKVSEVDKVMAELNKRVAESEMPLSGVPYNRLYMYFDIKEIQEALDQSGGLMPMSIKYKNGAISPEIPTGDITGMPGVRTVAVLRRNDALVDNGIVPENPYYRPNSGDGACIHDFKEIKNLEEALRIIGYVDGCVGEERGSHIVRKIIEEDEELIYRMMLNEYGVLIGISDIFGTGEFYQKIRRYGNMLREAMAKLEKEYGIGLYIATDQIEIVRHPRSSLYGQARGPLAVYVVEDGVRKIKIDEYVFKSPLLVYEELKHEFLESIARLIPGSNTAIADVVSTLQNIRGFLMASKEEQDGLLNLLRGSRILDPDGEYVALLERLSGISNVSDNEIIASIVRYVLRTKLYETMRSQLGLPDDLAKRIKDLEPRLDAALAVFNEIEEAKEMARRVKETEVKVDRTIKGLSPSFKRMRHSDKVKTYLEKARKDVKRMVEGGMIKEVHVIIGTEACDLDSIVASITYAYAKHRENPEELFIPIMNIPEEDFRLRTEAEYLLDLLGIKVDVLLFKGDLEELLRKGVDIKFVLVDHNKMPPGLSSQKDKVEGIIDHHKDEGEYLDLAERYIVKVGSTCTLVAERISETDLLNEAPELTFLLLSAILLDTLNLDKEKGIATPKDREEAKTLLARIGISQDVIFEWIRTAQRDISGLSYPDLLRKDFKKDYIGSVSCGYSTIFPITLDRFSKWEDLLNVLEKFREHKGLDVLFAMPVYEDEEGKVERGLVIYTKDAELLNSLINFLKELTPVQMEEVKGVSSILDKPNLKAFSIGNKISRKILKPLIDGFLRYVQTNGSGEKIAEAKVRVDKRAKILIQSIKKIKMIISWLLVVELRFVDTLLENNKYIMLDRSELEKPENKYIRDWIEKISAGKERSPFIYSDEGIPEGVNPDDVVYLIELEKVNEQLPNNRLYLPLPYSISSIYLASQVVLGGGKVSEIRDKLALNTIRALYETILGRDVADTELEQLFKAPWLVLPPIQQISATLNTLRKAIAQIEVAA